MTPVIKSVRPLSAVGLAALAVLSSCEKVDDGAATRAKGWDGVTLSTHIEDGDREVFTDTDETMVVDDGCAKTELDAHNILEANCKSCHGIGAASMGVPRFDFVMDDTQLMMKTWTREGAMPIRFLIPGDADNSAIYQRAVMNRDMPPLQADPQQPFYPRITYSQASVLHEWITNCFGGGTVTTPSTSTPGGG